MCIKHHGTGFHTWTQGREHKDLNESLSATTTLRMKQDLSVHRCLQRMHAPKFHEKTSFCSFWPLYTTISDNLGSRNMEDSRCCACLSQDVSARKRRL